MGPPAPAAAAPAPPPPPPPPPPSENGLFKANGSLPNASSSPKKLSTITSPPQLKKPHQSTKPRRRSQIRPAQSNKRRNCFEEVEAKEAQENGKGQGLSDVATILARRVAVEFSDSDDCPSDSEYDSDDWGETDA
eukprot:TRINITY_DN22139_c0_g1_i1.p1 TRINITY_DN22139_c0_g1~~TRINITY_DN22139_c0_g1_i1.p1  ORF type:complete len:154 (+),score=50.44 TRINITY_DN22139_c0_g1_i1:59-463(+)